MGTRIAFTAKVFKMRKIMLTRWFLHWFTALAMVLTFSSVAALAEVGYYRQPALSGDTVVFVAEGDLWRSNINGGNAQRLTTNLAEESNPAISPDGKWLAFTARYEGPAEVYVMPMAGGMPTRLTYDGDTARVQGFSPDGKILFSTQRYAGRPSSRLYAMDATTRVVTPIPLAEAAESCYQGRRLFFTRLPLPGDNVRGYKGGLAQNIWAFDGTSEATLLTKDYAGTSRQPMCGASRIYFLSDRDGLMNVWSMNASGGDLKQHTQHKTFEVRGASLSLGANSNTNTERIVYQRGADLYVLNPADNRETLINISLPSDFEQMRTRWVKNPWDFVTHVAPSPSGDRVAITARGQIFAAPVGAGRRVEVTRTAANTNVDARARFATFSHDGKSIYAFADTSGEMELWRYPANGAGAAQQLTRNAKVLRERAYPSPDGKWIAHTDKERRLYLLDTVTGTDKEVDRSIDEVPNEIAWSADSRWLVFTRTDKNFFRVLQLLEVVTNKVSPITSARYDSASATFSPDGKWLYFLSNRHLQSLVQSPWGQRTPEPFFDRQTRLYAYALDPSARWPFLVKDELQRTPEPPKEPVKDAAVTAAAPAPAPATPTPKVSALVFDGMRDRLYEVPIAPGNYTELSTDGKRLYFLSAETTVEKKLSLRSVPIEAPAVTPLITDLFFDEVQSYQLTQDRKKIFIRKANDLFVFDAGKSAPLLLEQGKSAVNLKDWTFQLDPREEWRQLFVDAWRMHRDYFYDANLHGIDWNAARARYEPLVARVTERSELNDVIAQMVAELAILHSQVGAPDTRRSNDNIDVASLAADLERTAQGFRVTKIFTGDTELLEERSPLSLPEVNVKVGDTITAINGITLGSSTNTNVSIGALLRNQIARQVLLSILEANGKSRDVIVVPVNTRRDRDLRYLTWERERAEQAAQKSNSRIGYVHLQAMGPNDIARWAREFYPVFQREGLIIDLRRNGGGSIDSWIIEKLQRRAWHFWKSRRADALFSNQQLAFNGHVVALIDAETYSDGETMAQGLKRLGIAPLIGMRTAGAGIWLSDQNRLRDNGIARAAETGSFVDDGKERAWITEGVGVSPDYVVDNLPFATFNGADAQLDAAIGYLLDKMAKEPMRKPIAPAYPVIERRSEK
jgi:tricorn protease